MSDYYFDPVLERKQKANENLLSVLENIGAEKFITLDYPDIITIDGKDFKAWPGCSKRVVEGRTIYDYVYQTTEKIDGTYPFFNVSVWIYRGKARFKTGLSYTSWCCW